MDVNQDIALLLLKLISKGGKDKSQVNIINVETVRINGQGQPKDEDLLLTLLKALPEPRMENLKRLVCNVALEHFLGNQTEAGKFLGIHRTSIPKQLREGQS